MGKRVQKNSNPLLNARRCSVIGVSWMRLLLARCDQLVICRGEGMVRRLGRLICAGGTRKRAAKTAPARARRGFSSAALKQANSHLRLEKLQFVVLNGLSNALPRNLAHMAPIHPTPAGNVRTDTKGRTWPARLYLRAPAAHVAAEESRDGVDHHQLDILRLHDERQMFQLTNTSGGAGPGVCGMGVPVFVISDSPGGLRLSGFLECALFD